MNVDEDVRISPLIRTLSVVPWIECGELADTSTPREQIAYLGQSFQEKALERFVAAKPFKSCIPSQGLVYCFECR